MSENIYSIMEEKTIQGYNLRCIDGSIHGCSKCVAYCAYEGHSGFLTEAQRKEHRCLEKGCFHHAPKPATVRDRRKPANSSLLQAALKATADMEGLRVIRVRQGAAGDWTVYYAAIAEYILSSVEQQISETYGCPVTMQKINCSFDTAAALVMQ